MKIERRKVDVVVLSDLTDLDPVKVYLEDLEPGRGSLTVTCYGEAWTAYWGAMGDRQVAAFIRSCGVDYLLGCLMVRRQGPRKAEARQEAYLGRIIRAVKEWLEQEVKDAAQ